MFDGNDAGFFRREHARNICRLRAGCLFENGVSNGRFVDVGRNDLEFRPAASSNALRAALAGASINRVDVRHWSGPFPAFDPDFRSFKSFRIIVADSSIDRRVTSMIGQPY